MGNRLHKTVQAICEMPSTFRRLGNISMIDLLRQSGYLVASDEVTDELLEKYLRNHPALIESWLIYSNDQRCSPTCLLDDPKGQFGNGSWVVGYVAKGGNVEEVKKFSDEYSACAYFIKKQVDKLKILV